jgi:hypothetical protein
VLIAKISQQAIIRWNMQQISHLSTPASPPTTTSVISPPTLFVVMTPDLTDEVVLLLSRYGWRSLHR